MALARVGAVILKAPIAAMLAPVAKVLKILEGLRFGLLEWVVWDMVKDDDDYRNEDVVVIGADTIVSHKGHILTKPKDTGNAFDILKELAGDCHQVYTGVTLIKNNNVVSNFAEKTDVYCNDISDNEIREYISTGEPMDKAGAYGIQGRFAAFIGKIDGDYNNVVGLPVARVYQELKLWLN